MRNYSKSYKNPLCSNQVACKCNIITQKDSYLTITTKDSLLPYNIANNRYEKYVNIYCIFGDRRLWKLICAFIYKPLRKVSH